MNPARGWQLSLACDGRTLYGQVYSAVPALGLPAGQFSTFDTSTGLYTVIPGFVLNNGASPPTAARDLAGPACSAAGSAVEVSVTKRLLSPPTGSNGNTISE